MAELHLFVKMAGYQFPVPWLNGQPIRAPQKIEMIDWYSQIIGYFPGPTEYDSRNSVLGILRLHGDTLYDDEFSAERTIHYDERSTWGRIRRVFHGIDMVHKFKAACDDGADLSNSIIGDLAMVWRDKEGKELCRDSMQNLRQVTKEIESRTIENSPLLAFWTGLKSEVEIGNGLQNGEAATLNVSSAVVLNAAAPDFVPNSVVLSLATLQTLSSENPLGNEPLNSPAQPILSPDTLPTSSASTQASFHADDSDPADKISVPTIYPEEPTPDANNRHNLTPESDSDSQSGKKGDDFGEDTMYLFEADDNGKLPLVIDSGYDTDDECTKCDPDPSRSFYGASPRRVIDQRRRRLRPGDGDCDLDTSEFPSSCQELDSHCEDRFVPDLDREGIEGS